MNTYTQLIDKHKGENAFVLGAGCSLYFNTKEPLFSKLHEYGIVIAVNSAVLADKKFDYWVSNDSLCRRWSWWKNVKKGKGIKVVRNSWLEFKKDLDGFLYFKPRPTSEDIINSEDVGLCYCSSVPSSIDLAIQMGCKKIFILGLDHTDHSGKDHFWQLWPSNLRPSAHPPAQGPWHQQSSLFPIHLKAYKALKKFAKEKNVEIYNCNPKSKVEVFKKIEFKNMKKLNKENKMEKIKTLMTLKDGEYLKKIKDYNHKWGVIFSQQSNSYQFYLIDDEYYIEVGSERRGAVPEINKGGFVYDVCADPQSKEEFRDKLIALFRNRIENELVSINTLIKIVNEDKDMGIEKIGIEEIK